MLKYIFKRTVQWFDKYPTWQQKVRFPDNLAEPLPFVKWIFCVLNSVCEAVVSVTAPTH